MNKLDREIVNEARALKWNVVTRDLVLLVDRLDKQLAEVKEAGEPFEKIERTLIGSSDKVELCILQTCSGDFTLGQLRRLAKALKEVGNE